MKKLAGALALSVVAMLSSAGGASAEQPEHEPTRGEVIAIAARFDAGVPTQADEAWAKRWPDIASAIPDGRRTEVGVTSQTVMLAATACHYADRYMIVKSGTGGKLYTYHTVLNSWCENGTSISSNQFSDYFSDINGAAMTDPKTGLIHQNIVKTSAHWVAYTGGSIRNCIYKYGCIGTKYPAQQISHYAGKGNTTYQWYNKDDGNGWQHQA